MCLLFGGVVVPVCREVANSRWLVLNTQIRQRI